MKRNRTKNNAAPGNDVNIHTQRKDLTQVDLQPQIISISDRYCEKHLRSRCVQVLKDDVLTEKEIVPE